ncbi:MAG: pilus assembly protein CpaF [Phycisphaeraceae bacterium]|nr:pilus assembly protein CpaF [Phycisphaeraceae bacterium]
MINNSQLLPVAANAGQYEPDLIQQIKVTVHRKLVETLDLLEAQRVPLEKLHAQCERRLEQLLGEQSYPLSAREREHLLREVMDEIFGLGPLEGILRDPNISDILVNGSRNVYVERNGRLERSDACFRDDQHLMQVIQRVAARAGRRIDESSPMLDARLSDGSRVNAIIPPLALDGPTMSVRRFGATPLDIDRLVALGAMVPEMVTFLEACVSSRMNLLISGGTGSGKTTLLNALSRWIAEDDRAVTIEDAAELRLQKRHVVRLETRPPNIEGVGEVTQRDLLRNALRMRPDRIIIGEVRGAEALDMLQAMNTGHDGSMTTAHANSPRDALGRVENMVSMAGLNYPVQVIRQQVSSSLDLIIHVDRLTGGRRRIVNVAEITGMESDVVLLQDLFRFVQTRVGRDGHAEGHFEACGIRPRLLDRLAAEGHEITDALFRRRRIAHRQEG